MHSQHCFKSFQGLGSWKENVFPWAPCLKSSNTWALGTTELIPVELSRIWL